jgi:hypothetical protein
VQPTWRPTPRRATAPTAWWRSRLVGSNFDDVLFGDGVSNLLVAQEGDGVVDAGGSGTLGGSGRSDRRGGGGDVLDGDAGADRDTEDARARDRGPDAQDGDGLGADSLSGIR